jgi:hypothetical protein
MTYVQKSYLTCNFQNGQINRPGHGRFWVLSCPSYSPPSGYQVSEPHKPELNDEKYVIINVHAASINHIDVKRASGVLKIQRA